jgi:hypothetical protein
MDVAPIRAKRPAIREDEVSGARNFRLNSAHSVLAPHAIVRTATLCVVAGEACTELGCEGTRAVPKRLTQWLRLRLRLRTLRKGSWN